MCRVLLYTLLLSTCLMCVIIQCCLYRYIMSVATFGSKWSRIISFGCLSLVSSWRGGLRRPRGEAEDAHQRPQPHPARMWARPLLLSPTSTRSSHRPSWHCRRRFGADPIDETATTRLVMIINTSELLYLHLITVLLVRYLFCSCITLHSCLASFSVLFGRMYWL